jgi:hypothetical protein
LENPHLNSKEAIYHMVKQFLTLVWSIAAAAILACPVVGWQQSKLRGGNPLEQDNSTTTAADIDVVDRRHHRVLARDLRGKPKVVQGNFGKLKKGKK